MLGYSTQSLSEIWADLQSDVSSIQHLGVPDDGNQRREAIKKLYMKRNNTDVVPVSALAPAATAEDFHLALQGYQAHFYGLRRERAGALVHRK